MAIERIQVIYCDPHQAQGQKVEGEHYKLSLNGETVKVDLCTDCEALYLSGVYELIQLVRKPAPKKKSAAKKKGPDAKGPDTMVVREWAEANGYEINPRGRIPADIMAAYEAAQS